MASNSATIARFGTGSVGIVEEFPQPEELLGRRLINVTQRRETETGAHAFAQQHSAGMFEEEQRLFWPVQTERCSGGLGGQSGELGETVLAVGTLQLTRCDLRQHRRIFPSWL